MRRLRLPALGLALGLAGSLLQAEPNPSSLSLDAGFGLPSQGPARTTTAVRLLAEAEAVRPGDTFLAAVELRMAPEWHTYWFNPGDSGDATKIAWTLPAGLTAGAIQWPPPSRYSVDNFTTYVLDGEALLLVPITVAQDAPVGTVELRAKVSWLECREVCIPGTTEVQTTLTVGSERRPSAEAPLIARGQARLPVKLDPGNILRAGWEQPPAGSSNRVGLLWKTAASGAAFFPYPSADPEILSATESATPGPGTVLLWKPVRREQGAWPTHLEGVLVATGTSNTPPAAFEVRLPIAATPPTFDAAAAAGTGSLPLMLLFAFLGGLLLNFMPCVLPIIALKVLSFVQQSREAPARVRMLGLVYGLGVIACFLGLAALALGVQQAGGLASWGMLLQHQPVRVLLTVLITLVTLNLFGVFEITLDSRVLNQAAEVSSREGPAGAFFNGLLAAVLATPCTAPFLGAALAFAFAQPPLVVILVFLAAGLGLALPFVLLCWNPAWLSVLPKPGPWMTRFRTAMGFPMLATAVWLFWFTAPRFGHSGVLWLGLFLVILAAAAWTWGEFVQRSSQRRGLAMALSLLLLAGGYWVALENRLDWRHARTAAAAVTTSKESDGIPWQPWSPEAVARARAEGRVVLVDFTADNCLNCQVNKATSLEIPETRARLGALNAAAFLGDFTDQDPRIAAELRRHQRAGVPLVLVYPRQADGPPIVLPPVLTPGLVRDALERAAAAE